MHYCHEPQKSYNFTKICQIFISKMSTISDLTNHIMIPGADIIERRHQQNVYRLSHFIQAHREPVRRLTKRHFLALVKHYIINLEFLNSTFYSTKFPTRAQTNCKSTHLTFVYVSAILKFVNVIRSGTDHFLQRISFILFSSFKPPLVASNGLEIVRDTRQAKHDSTTTGQANFVGIEPSL